VAQTAYKNSSSFEARRSTPMKKTDKTQKGKKPSERVPAKPKDVTELTDQDLEQVQGGRGLTPEKVEAGSENVKLIKG